MGSRSRRKQRPGARADGPEMAAGGATSGAAVPLEPGTGAATAKPPTRSEVRNAEARARLTPIALGERPLAIRIAVGVCLLVAVLNAVLLAVGYDVAGAERTDIITQFALSELILLVAAGGMWQKKYWAVLGFQALLGISVAISTLSLVAASNITAVALCLTLIALGGTLFWHLVKVMGRLQIPRPGAEA